MEQLKLLKRKIGESSFFSSPFYLKYNRFIVPAMVLIIALLISALVTVPQVFKLFETFKTIDGLNQKKSFYQKKTEELEGLNLPDTRQELETALVALPVDKDITGVTGELLVALSGSGMSLDAISFSSTAPESEKVQEYSLRMDVSGNEESLKSFLDRVKVTPRLIKLSSIDISKGTRTSLSASIGFVTLYQQLPQNVGSVDEDVPKITAADRQILSDIQAKIISLPRITQTEASGSATGKLNPFSQ